MFDTLHTLEVSAEELVVIETALQTQSKILNLQASAGGHAAREQLNQVKCALATIEQQKPCETVKSTPTKTNRFGLSRIFG